ncbi:hypothetical protein VD0004_g6465 [Verticillium dahliae]|uniref:DUF676 domain-containing protein n=1 Tax=Verticillium dahliae TaxID=27337 RepID=A0A444RNU4_VERDA|nr:hypothetical protein VD0004_g6465 [Verticillium dahliae]PNH76097.1 hypothetical protein VD0001_g1431 [Verticillium dahliae]RXG42829.1 hypothetical protein VDGE_09816 [Verticillium dahliae]
MKKTLILCFIHGFKGGDDTFGEGYEFTEHLRSLVEQALPKLNVQVLVYPKYETRGDLGNCVSRFRDWLQEKVIDIEVEAGTSSPTVDPSVRTILIGHSMGGIVAAETVIGLTSDKPIYSEDGVEKSAQTPTSFNSLMFPYVQGVLAFDTPYLGISPGVVAHGAEGHYTAASAAMTQLSGLGTALWGATPNKSASPGPANASRAPVAALPAPSSPGGTTTQQQQQQNPWAKWGKIAAIAGGAAAVAAGGAAAYMNRDQLTQGWTWATSHLEFVGCLAKGGELQKRVQYMTKVHQELDVGFANLYTRLGRGAAAKDVSVVGTVLGKDRTFCNLPKRGDAGVWKPAVNDKAEEETQAHMAMFERKNNPGYEALARDATDLIATWTRNAWYESSVEDAPALKQSAEDGSSRREDGSSRQGERRPAEEKVLGQEENPWA